MRSIVAVGVLCLLSLATAPRPALGQEINPYGRIDPAEASAAVLRRGVGPGGSPVVLDALIESAPPELDRLLEALLEHPDAAMRTAAAVGLATRGTADPRRLVARVGDDDARAAFVVALLGDGGLDPATAAAMLDADLAGSSELATTLLAARASRDDDAPRLKRVLEATPNEAPLAQGIAAGVLESTRPGAIAGWHAGLGDLGREPADALTFAALGMLERLEAIEGLMALERVTADRPPDDAIRAAVVLALLRLKPEAGAEAWSRLQSDGGPGRAMANAMLVVSAERPMPRVGADALPDGDALQKGVRRLVAAAPADRVPASIDAVRAGHLPTIRWLLDLPEGRVSAEVLEAMIDASLAHRRTAMVEVLFLAARRLAATDVDAVADRLDAAAEVSDEVATEALLRGLIAAASPEAAAVARPLVNGPDRRTRSLALLAVARGDGLEGAARSRLGRAAAGGGDLPDDLRALAAWQHLLLENRVDTLVPGLITP